MGDASTVAIFNALENLFENSFCIRLFKSSVRLRFKVAMEAWTSHIFHYQYDILRCVNDLIEPYNVLMLHLLHEFDLSLDRFPSVRVEQLILFVNLHSNFLICWLMKANSNNRICTLPDLLPNYIVIKRALI